MNHNVKVRQTEISELSDKFANAFWALLYRNRNTDFGKDAQHVSYHYTLPTPGHLSHRELRLLKQEICDKLSVRCQKLSDVQFKRNDVSCVILTAYFNAEDIAYVT